MIITIIGKGFVGKATGLLQNEYIKIQYYDQIPSLCDPINESLENMVEKSEIIFICAPTPMNIDGNCNTTIIESIIDKIKNVSKNKIIIMRSTIPIGFCDIHEIFFMPEFLTEKGYLQDFKDNNCWIFGYPLNINEKKLKEFKTKISYVINTAYESNILKSKKIKYIKNKEAELVKLVRNSFLSSKVGFFNEIYDLCKSFNIDYNNVREGITLDPRIGSSHSYIDIKNRGYGGTCFPKDTNHLYNIFQERKIISKYLEANIDRNENIDRIEKDWLLGKNRAYSDIKEKINIYIDPSLFFLYNIKDKLKNNEWIIILLNENNNNNKYIIELTKEYKKIIIKNYNIDQKIFIPYFDELHLMISKNQTLIEKNKILIKVLDMINNKSINYFYFLTNDESSPYFIKLCEEKNIITIIEIEDDN